MCSWAKKPQLATLADLQFLALTNSQLAAILTPLLQDPSRQQELQQLLLQLQLLQGLICLTCLNALFK